MFSVDLSFHKQNKMSSEDQSLYMKNQTFVFGDKTSLVQFFFTVNTYKEKKWGI